MHISAASFIIAISLIAPIAFGKTESESLVVAQKQPGPVVKSSPIIKSSPGNGRQLLLISSSRVPGYGYLRNPQKQIMDFCKRNKVSQILFVPYAIRNHNEATEKVTKALRGFISKDFPQGLKITSLHTYKDKVQAVSKAECIFVGGGNTFLLLKTLYDLNLVDLIRERVLSGELPYMGWSAGSNVATTSIQTTNDMPIVFPATFDALGLVPFNINPHYPKDPSRLKVVKDKLKEFHQWNTTPVLALREGTALRVDGNRAKLVGTTYAQLLRKGKKPLEIAPNTDLSFLLKWK